MVVIVSITYSDWPQYGRVGVSQSGPSKGQHIFLAPDTAPERWLLFLEHPADRFSFGEALMTGDNYPISDSDVNFMIEYWGVEWLSPGPQEENFSVLCSTCGGA